METALRLTTRVQSGGKIEVTDARLPVGVQVEVIVLIPSAEGSLLNNTGPEGIALDPEDLEGIELDPARVPRPFDAPAEP